MQMSSRRTQGPVAVMPSAPRREDGDGGEDCVFSVGNECAMLRLERDATLMKKSGNSFELSATDLVGYLNCHHLTGLDRARQHGR